MKKVIGIKPKKPFSLAGTLFGIAAQEFLFKNPFKSAPKTTKRRQVWRRLPNPDNKFTGQPRWYRRRNLGKNKRHLKTIEARAKRTGVI